MTVPTQMLGLLGWLVISFGAAALGSFASGNAGAFYRELVRPEWAPPAWLFAPTWSVLYFLMGIAAWLVWRERGFRESSAALSLFLTQLVASALWPWFFFVWRFGALAFVEMIILTALIVCTVVAFWRVRAVAGALLIPYLAWVAFASALTYSVWKGNPALLG